MSQPCDKCGGFVHWEGDMLTCIMCGKWHNRPEVLELPPKRKGQGPSTDKLAGRKPLPGYTRG